MIAMTTSISTKVKPASARRTARRLPDFTHSLIALLLTRAIVHPHAIDQRTERALELRARSPPPCRRIFHPADRIFPTVPGVRFQRPFRLD
jgi:hypothetical protein